MKIFYTYVILNEEGMKLFNTPILKKIRGEHDYFTCTKVEEGQYLNLEIPMPDDPTEKLRLSIHHRHVSFYFSGMEAHQFFGF